MIVSVVVAAGCRKKGIAASSHIEEVCNAMRIIGRTCPPCTWGNGEKHVDPLPRTEKWHGGGASFLVRALHRLGASRLELEHRVRSLTVEARMVCPRTG